MIISLQHDPNTAECSPGAENGGNYIMNSRASTLNGILPNNNKFSPCSRRDMLAILQSSKASCFICKYTLNMSM